MSSVLALARAQRDYSWLLPPVLVPALAKKQKKTTTTKKKGCGSGTASKKN